MRLFGDTAANLPGMDEFAEEPVRPERTPRRAWVPLAILAVGLVMLLYSMQLGGVTASGYDLQRLEAERNEWRQRNEQLELELAKVQSLAWIEVEATRRLGMQRAERVTYLEVVPPPDTAEPPTDTAPEARGAEPSPRPDLLGLWRALLTHLVPPVEAGGHP